MWAQKTAGDSGRSGAAIIGEYAVHGDLSGHLYVVNYTGYVIDIFDINTLPGILGAGINSTIVYADGRLYFTASTAMSGYCISMQITSSGQFADGSVRWTVIGATSSTPSIYNGYIYVGSGTPTSTSGRLYCIEASTGRAVWSRTLPGPVLSSPAIMIMFHGDIYVGVTTASSAGALYIFDNDGVVVFKHTPSEDEAGYCIQGVAIFDESMIYANSRGYVFSIASNGSLPKAAFIGSPVDGAVPLTVKFMDCSMYDPTYWAWDFDGDGTIDSYEEDPVNTFPEIGFYNITLTVVNFKGTATITREYYIDVQERSPSIDGAATASVLSVTYVGDDITYKLSIMNDGNLDLFGVSLTTTLIAHYRDGHTEIRHWDERSVIALRDRVQNYYLDYSLAEEDLECIYLECVFDIVHAEEGLRYQITSGVYVKIPHDPISIDGDADLIATAAAEGWKGDGSAESPFIIENYDIRVNSVYWTGDILDEVVPKVIELRNITLHIVVRNCTTVAITETPVGMVYEQWYQEMIESMGSEEEFIEWLSEMLRTMTLDELIDMIEDGRILNVTAVHVLMVNCTNVAMFNNIITPLADASIYLDDNLNYGIVMIDCRDNKVENTTMPAYQADAALGSRHSVNIALYMTDCQDNVISNMTVAERSFSNYDPDYLKVDVVLVSGSVGNTLRSLAVASGGITVSDSHRTTIIDVYAKNGLVLEDSDECVLNGFSGYVSGIAIGGTFSHGVPTSIPSTVSISNCNYLSIRNSTFADNIFITGSTGLRVENNSFLNMKLELNSCSGAYISGNNFNHSCGTAIGLISCSNVEISNNTIDMYWFVVLERPGSMFTYQYWTKGLGVSSDSVSTGNLISNNTIFNCETGIASRGDGNIVRYNVLVNCTAGILLKGSDTIDNNTLRGCTYGIKLEESDGAMVINNHLHGSNIYIGPKSKDTLVDANDLHDGTFILDVTSSSSGNLASIDITDSNTVNSGRFIYLISRDMGGATIGEAGQILLIDVSNLVIEDLVVDGGYNAITVIGSSGITIRGTVLTNMTVSISLKNSNGVHIEGSSIQGLEIISCADCTVTDCIIDRSHGNGTTIMSSRSVVLTGVTISNSSSNGVLISMSENVDIRSCIIENNDVNGIYAKNSTGVVIFDGHLMSNYHNTILFENSLSSNVSNSTMIDGLNGVLCEGSDGITIRNNTLQNHIRYGISLGPGSDGNVVVNNVFDGNAGSGSFYRSYYRQVEDLGSGNRWNDDRGGNWWYDWQNMQGMPYIISSSPYVADALPLDVRYIDHWSAPQHDNWHSGSSTSTVPLTNSTVWTADGIRLVDGSSAVSGAGMVFVQSVGLDGTTLLCAFVADEGEMVWTTSITQSKSGSTFTPVYHKGIVYAPGGAYDAFTGKRLWKDNVTDHSGGGYLVQDDVAVIGDWGSGRMMAYNATTGQLLWEMALDGLPESTPALCGTDIVLTTVSGSAGHVYRIGLHSGAVVWKVTFEGYENRTIGSATVDGDVIYVTTLNMYGFGHLYALRCEDGSTIWSAEIVSTASSVAVDAGRIYVSCGFDDAMGRRTYCIDATDGSIIWEVRGIGSAYCGPAVADGKVIVGNHETGLLYGDLYYLGTFVLDAETGAVIWQSDLGGSSAMVYDGRVYTIGDGMLFVFGEVK
jgi:parallel beta-helix repeat protein